MAIKQLTEEQVRTWTLEQKDRWWFENVWRGDMPQLTVRAAVSGAMIGGLLSMTNLYVGAKTGWTLGVGITGAIKKGLAVALGADTAADGDGLIGMFGIGLFSAFMLADRLTVESRKLDHPEAVRWEAGAGGTAPVHDRCASTRGPTRVLSPTEALTGVTGRSGFIEVGRVLRRPGGDERHRRGHLPLRRGRTHAGSARRSASVSACCRPATPCKLTPR